MSTFSMPALQIPAQMQSSPLFLQSIPQQQSNSNIINYQSISSPPITLNNINLLQLQMYQIQQLQNQIKLQQIQLKQLQLQQLQQPYITNNSNVNTNQTSISSMAMSIPLTNSAVTAYTPTPIRYLPQPQSQQLVITNTVPNPNANPNPAPNMAMTMSVPVSMTISNPNSPTQSSPSPVTPMLYPQQSNMSMTTLPPTSTTCHQNNISNIQQQQQQQNKSTPQQPVHANSRNNSPRLIPISEEKSFDDDNNECCMNEQFLNPSATPFSPTPPTSPSLTPNPPKRQSPVTKSSLFIPKFPARAQLNIYIARDMTQYLVNIIHEKFPSPMELYYYLDISTAFQINDKQMYIFKYDDNTNSETQKIVFVHYDLHHKDTNDTLYGCIIENKEHTIKQNKWLWKLDKFMTATEIYNQYGITLDQLPKSSRQNTEFQQELNTQFQSVRNMNINLDILHNTDWCNIQQIKSLRRDKKRNNKHLQIVAKITRSEWIEQCNKSWNEFEAIPIVVNNNKNYDDIKGKETKKHWIEWVKLIGINPPSSSAENDKLYVGISCKYEKEKNQWMIKSICLDKGDIQNKCRLVGLTEETKQKYIEYFANFNTTFTEIQWH